MKNTINLKPPFSILVLDDEPDLADTIGDYLELLFEDRIVVHKVYSGDEALDFIKNNPTDVLIADLEMTGTHGYTVLKEANDINRGVIKVICTGNSSFLSLSSARAAGAIAVILKPITDKEIKRAIGPIIDELHTWFYAFSGKKAS